MHQPILAAQFYSSHSDVMLRAHPDCACRACHRQGPTAQAYNIPLSPDTGQRQKGEVD